MVADRPLVAPDARFPAKAYSTLETTVPVVRFWTTTRSVQPPPADPVPRLAVVQLTVNDPSPAGDPTDSPSTLRSGYGARVIRNVSAEAVALSPSSRNSYTPLVASVW